MNLMRIMLSVGLLLVVSVNLVAGEVTFVNKTNFPIVVAFVRTEVKDLAGKSYRTIQNGRLSHLYAASEWPGIQSKELKVIQPGAEAKVVGYPRNASRYDRAIWVVDRDSSYMLQDALRSGLAEELEIGRFEVGLLSKVYITYSGGAFKFSRTLLGSKI